MSNQPDLFTPLYGDTKSQQRAADFGHQQNDRRLQTYYEAIDQAVEATRTAAQSLYELDWELLPDQDIDEIVERHKLIHGAAGHLHVVVTRIKHHGTTN